MINLGIPRKSALLKVDQFGAKSNEVEVKNGDTIEIKTTKWNYIIFLLGILSPILFRNLIQDLRIYIFLFTLLVSCAYLVDNFKLRILNRQSGDASFN